MEAEYYGLVDLMKSLLPLRRQLIETSQRLSLPFELSTHVSARVFEDNNSTLILATNQRITSRTRYFLTKWHWFWQAVRGNPESGEDPEVTLHRVNTDENSSDYLTKFCPREVHEKVRRLAQGW